MATYNQDVLEAGSVLFGYRVLEFVGEGATSFVYKAQHPELPRLVAIKQLKREFVEDEHALEHFLLEANVVAHLNHPNIVIIYDLKHDRDAGRHFIITEFAEGGTLADRLIKSPEGLPVDEALHIAMGICSGLEAVHRMGIVHRDIKPSNILLCGVKGGQDTPKLSDFGLARVSALKGIDIPQESGVCGSIPYMSPEQQGEETEIDHRSDLYSLGVLLYELLTGQVPFIGEPLEVLLNHMYLAPKPPRELNPDIPVEVEQIVLRMLRKNPRERYPSAGDVWEALQAIADISLREERRHRFQTFLDQGLKFLKEGRWGEAIEALRQADILEPGDERVQRGLREALDRQDLDRRYDLGVRHLHEEDWEQAQDYLARVIGYDPDYADGQAKELLQLATQKLEQARRQRDLMVRYQTGMGYLRTRQWSQAIAELEGIVAQAPEFEDATIRLKEAREYLRAEQLFQQARHHREQGEWAEAIDLFEEVRRLAPPHIDVTEELEHARKRGFETRREQELAGLYAQGITLLNRGRLEQARTHFTRISERQPDYRDVKEQLEDIEKKLQMKRFFDQASERERACDWETAIEIYKRILVLDPYDRKATHHLERAQRRVQWKDRKGLYEIAARVCDWWGNRGRQTRAALIGLSGIIVIALCGAALQATGVWSLPQLLHAPLTPAPTSPSTFFPTDTPAATSTPDPAIRLAGPAQGTSFARGQNVKLEWMWKQELAEDELFEVRIRPKGEQTFRQMSQTKLWYQYVSTSRLTRAGTYEWQVAIVSRAGEERRSSAIWSFEVEP